MNPVTNNMSLTTSPPAQTAGKPRSFASLALPLRHLRARPRRNITGKEHDSETGLYYYGARYWYVDLDGREDDDLNYLKADTIFGILDNFLLKIETRQEQTKILRAFSGNDINARFALVEGYADDFVNQRRASFEMTGDQQDIQNCPDYQTIQNVVYRLFDKYTNAYNEFWPSLAKEGLKNDIMYFINVECRRTYGINNENINLIERAITYRHFLGV